jgi:hypothetical protein
LGLLDDESREIIDNYYPELLKIENELEKFDLIYGASHEYLGYLLVWNIPGHFDYDDGFLGGDEIEEFLRHTKKVYDLGYIPQIIATKLISKLNINHILFELSKSNAQAVFQFQDRVNYPLI